MVRTRLVHASLALLLALSFTASGCTFWRNFSTYFNILYLAQQHLDYYEDQIREQPAAQTGAQQTLTHRWLDEEYETYQNALRKGTPAKIVASFMKGRTPVTKSGNLLHLDSAIILGSKILANKKETKYVEDALFIVGKAEFYKNDYVMARRKFLELLTKYPDTRFGPEAQLFLARSMLSANQLDTAGMALKAAMEQGESQSNDRILADAHQALAEYLFVKKPDTLAAIASELEKSADHLKGAEASRMAFESGAVYYMAADWAKAQQLFERAAAQAKDEALEGEAKIAHALATRRLGQFAEAKTELASVAERAKYSGSHPAGRYELAYTEDLEARNAVNGDLRQPVYRNEYLPKVRQGYFVVDTMFRKESQLIAARVNYRVAELFRGVGMYDSATRYAVPLIGTKDFGTTAMSEYVSERMRALAQFSRWRDQLTAVDSIEREVQTTRRVPRPEYEVVKEQAAIHGAALQEVLGDKWRPDARPDLSAEDQKKVADVEARMRKEKAALTPKFMIGDTSRFLDSLHYTRANALFEIGRAYENFGEIPAARANFQQASLAHFIIRDTLNEALKAQIVYAWLQLEAREKNMPRRDSLLNVLATFYGETIYAQQARSQYGAEKSENTPSEIAYREAYHTLARQGVESAKGGLLNVYQTYKHEDVAPRSLYAIGLSYEEASKFDSALAYYKQVAAEYPYSPYADALRPRLADAGVKAPKQTARRVGDPNMIKSEDEKQREELERLKREREQELRNHPSDTPNGPGGDVPINPTQQPPTIQRGQVSRPDGPQVIKGPQPNPVPLNDPASGSIPPMPPVPPPPPPQEKH